MGNYDLVILIYAFKAELMHVSFKVKSALNALLYFLNNNASTKVFLFP